MVRKAVSLVNVEGGRIAIYRGENLRSVEINRSGDSPQQEPKGIEQ
jgi:hypothetical protein